MSVTVTVSSKSTLQQILWRWTLLIHRYLGIAVGVVVFVWCGSGIVMMYVPYPSVTDADQLTGLAPLDLDGCCDATRFEPQQTVLAVDSFTVEMWDGGPHLRATLTSGERVLFDLRSGRELRALDRDALVAAGLAMARRIELTGARYVADVDLDQWTVHSRFNRHRPMLQFEDRAGARWYVSSQTGEMVQFTEVSERFWNWLGSVVHWLYPTFIRQHTPVWAQTVIWLTILALFLTVTGIAYGIKQFKTRASGRKSPYSGWSLWHHYSGLIFGLFTLTWLISGLFSMNPWGALEPRNFDAERSRVQGAAVTLGAAVRFVGEIRDSVPGPAVRLESVRLLGEMFVLVHDRQANVVRIGAGGIQDPLPADHAQRLAPLLGPANRLVSLTLLEHGDAYYYNHHDDKPFPVFRYVFDNGERYYLDPVAARIELAVDQNSAWYRWLFNALHTGDFHALARSRPTWDLWMGLLIAGLIVGSGSGVVLAWRRVT